MSARGCLGPAGSLLSAVDAVIRRKGDQFRQGAVLAQHVLLRTKQGLKGGSQRASTQSGKCPMLPPLSPKARERGTLLFSLLWELRITKAYPIST